MSTIKVNTVTKRTGSTLTLGESGTTVTLACGATQTGFGRAGSVNWCSTVYTNSPGTVTATSGKGFFLDTTSGTITINLPSSPSFGDIVAIKDYAATFSSNNATVGRGGSKIGGETLDAVLSTDGDAITLVYVDGTKGWLNVNTDDTVQGARYVAATGGTVATSGNFKIHTFTGDGCFQVTDAGNAAGANTIEYMVVGGGGGGGGPAGGGGGGAGGYRESSGATAGGYSVSPLGGCVSALSASVATFPISVGAGGTAGGSGSAGGNGCNSIFSTITSTGGGGGAAFGSSPVHAKTGGSGGGGGGRAPCSSYQGAAGNTPPVSPPQGNPGGDTNPSTSNPDRGGGGGGATVAGTTPSGNNAGPGGDGATSSINNTPTARAGGGGGGKDEDSPNGGTSGEGGSGGGGRGASADSSNSRAGVAGTTNTGGGGGGAGGGGPTPYPVGYAGGSGIVILRYKFQ